MRPMNEWYVLGLTMLMFVCPVSIGTPFTSVVFRFRNVGLPA